MDATVIEVLVNHITQFGSLSPKSEYAQRYYEKIVEILSLLNSVLDKVLASEISLTGKIKNILEELDGHINNARELLESWHQLSSKLYFALHVEYAITKIQACTKETFQLVHLIFESLPDKSHLACVESCLQKTEDLVYEPILEFIKGAMNDQSENLDLDSGPVLKISNALSLSSNEELLMEAVALDKLKTKLGQVESPEDLEYIDPLVSLINRMHDSYVRAHQLPSMNDIQIPADFCCPLSLKLMSDPVIVASGQTYERAFIRKWLDHGLTFCPKTRQPLGHANLIPNYTVKALIANWCESNNIKLSDPVRSATLTQPSTFAAYVDTDAVDDSNLSRFGHPKNLISRSAELARSTPSSNGSGSLANGFSSAAGRISAEELSSGSLGQLPDQPKMECSSGGKELDGHETTSSASGAEYVRGEEGSDVSGEMVAQEAAASSSSQSGRQPEPRSRGQNQSTWRRPTDRFIPRIISSPSVDTRPDLSEVEADVRRLIEDLKSESVELQRNATQELRLLAKHNMENRIVIANCGAVSHLVNLLLSTDAKTQENAVTALLNLSINDNNKIAIANADAISPLILVLETGNPEAKENSAATLFSLSVIEENKVKIGRSGAIKPLVELLGNGTPRGKRDAATALFNLSIFHENKARIVQAGAVKHLVELMDPAAGMVDKAVAVLANIATIHEGRIAIGQEGGIPALVEVVELGSARGKENAAAALLHLCTNSNKFCTMVLQEGAVPPLVALSQSGTPRAREKAQLLLTHFRNQRHGGGRS